jgi:pyruvate dehydrogenase E1 component subunit alpha
LIEHFDPLKGERLQILSETGAADPKLEPALSGEDLKKIYTLMVTARSADLKALRLQRQGRMGTFAQSLGHEACQVGSAMAVGPEDWVFPYFRDLGTFITLGLPLKNYYLLWMGSEEGNRIPEGLNIFTITIPVSTQLPQAVGFALALKYRKEPAAVAAYFGDGATSEGDFNEALNFAGVLRAPVVFICVNNQYAISTPVGRQTASRTIAQKAVAYGFPGIRVDGNDALAMYAASKEALERARSGGGPTLIEAFTYRLSDHTTSDDASRYRTKDEVGVWAKRDPIERFRLYLKSKGLWDEAFETRINQEADDRINRAVEEAESAPPPAPEDYFAYTYKDMPPQLKDELADLLDFVKEGRR